MTAQSGLGFSGIVAINIPDDGAAGTVLTKITADNYDYDWLPGGGGGGAPTDAEYVVLSLDPTLTDERVLVGGAGLTLTDGGAGGNVTLDVVANVDGSIVVNADDIQVGVISDAQHGNLSGGALHALAVASVSAGFISGADQQKLDDLITNAVPETRTLTAGAGMVGGGDLSADRTFDVVANADGSIVVNANDIQVGVLATDAQHGNRGGGSLHALAVASGAAGFISGADQQKLDDLITNAVPETRTLTAGAGLTGGGDLSADRTFDVGAGTGIVVNANDVQLDLADNRNVDHSAVVLTAGLGLAGGGDITASRTFDVNVQNSITINVDTLELVNDVAAPGANQVYGTDGAGVKGWKADPAGGSGDVVGPASSTDNAIVRFDGVTGKLIQNSGVIIDDSDNLTIPIGATLFTNDVEETTIDAGITFTANVASVAAQGSTLFDGESWRISSPRNGLGDQLVIGWIDAPDAATPQGFGIRRTSLSGFFYFMPDAPNPQVIGGDDTDTGTWFIDGNGNKDILFNALDTGPGTAINKQTGFGAGGIYLTASAGGGQINIFAPNIGGATYTLTLPVDDGNAGEVLTTDGTGVTSWEDGDSLGFVTVGAPAQTITSVKTFNPFGTGALGSNDIVIGDVADYGLAAIGNSIWGRTNFNAAALDLDGSVLIFNQALPATSNIEFAFADGTNNLRFALAVPGVGNATYNPRSMLIAGPAVLDDEVVTVGYWRTNNNIFDNIDCDTALNGADLGVQNDLEVEGIIYVDDIEESTVDAGITFTANVAVAAAQGSTVFNGEAWEISSPRNGLGDSLVVGWQDTGDATTPNQFAINRSGVSGFLFLMSNANTPQFIIGANNNTSSVFIDGNGNKDIRFNTLDTGPDRDNVVIFGFGGINLQDQGGDAIFIRSPAVVAGTYTLTLPDTDGNTGQLLENTDGAGTLDWRDPPATPIPGSLTEAGSTNITTVVTTVGIDTEQLDPDNNYAAVAGEVTLTEGGYMDISYSIPTTVDSAGGAVRGKITAFMERDQGTGTWITIPQSFAAVYTREATPGSGLSASFIALIADGEAVRIRISINSTTDISTTAGQSSLSLHRVRNT